jgi:tRNA(Ile)-lysidine synthetase-like protein
VVKLKPHQPVGFKGGERVVNLSGGGGDVLFGDARVSWSRDERTDFKRSRDGSAYECLDADKVGRKIMLRHWRPGDRFQPIGFKSLVKLQDLFTNAKIPREQRHHLLVAATAGGEIFWVEGLRISEGFKLTPVTKRRLVWRWQHPQSAGAGTKTVIALRANKSRLRTKA